MVVVAELTQSGQYNPETVRRLLDYSYGEHVLAEDEGMGYDLTVERTCLTGLSRYRQASQYRIALDDQMLTTELDVSRTGYQGDNAPFLWCNTQPSHDALRIKVSSMLDDSTGKLLGYMMGDFEDETDLDEGLGAIWLSYQGTSQEQEVGPTLDLVRNRAIAFKDSNQLQVNNNLNLPTTEKLDEIEEALVDSLS